MKDSAWSYFPYKISSAQKTGNDGGLFKLADFRISLMNVFIPNAKRTDDKKRIPLYDGKFLNYVFKIDTSEDIQISMIFEYEDSKYSLIIDKSNNEKWAILKIFESNRMLATYEGPLKP